MSYRSRRFDRSDKVDGRRFPWTTLTAGALAVLTSCASGAPAGSPPGPRTAESGGAAVSPTLASQLDDASRAWVEETLAGLTLEEAVGQLVFPWISGAYTAEDDSTFLEAVDWVDRWKIGGLAISIGTPYAYVEKLNALQERARVPLLVGSDFENGGPGMRINHTYALPSLLPQGGGTSFPPTMAFGAIGDETEVERFARITAEEARAVGVQLNFAPVLDVNSNPENPIINTRSFGEDPAEVARLGRAYIRGAHEGGVLTTAKHFPGHGDTRVDSHIQIPEVTADRQRLETFELVPFRAAVDEGVDAVMTAHVSVPGVLGPSAPPATLSPEFMTTILRQEMGFSGLLFTDALSMGAITEGYGAGEAAVLALEAGADVILIPASVPLAVEAVLQAVRDGRLTRERIDDSVRRILTAKARVGLDRQRTVSLDQVSRVVGTKAHLDAADEAAARSITLPRDRDGLVPLDRGRIGSILSVTYAAPTDIVAGTEFNAVLGTFGADVEAVHIGPESTAGELDELLDRAGSFDVVLVSAYVPPRSGAGSVALPDPVEAFVEEVAERYPMVLISFGNPYLLNAVPSVGSYLIAWGDREVSQRAGARAVIGAAPIEGKLPITLPGLHERGEGISRGPRAAPEAPNFGLQVPPEGVPAPGSWRGLPVSPLEVAPASVGMDPAALAELDAYMSGARADSVSPGAALAVGRHGRLVRLRGYGRLDWDSGSPEVTPFSLYDLASLTKVVGTTSALMLLSQEGVIGLDDPVVAYLPEFARGDPRKAEVTIRDLLLHRSGLPAYRAFYEEVQGVEAMKAAVYDLPLEAPPRARVEYSDLGFMTLGWVVEAATGESLDAFLERRVFRPLGMFDTEFNPAAAERERAAPTELGTARRSYQIRGEVHDENAFAMGGISGHAGLFSTAEDLAVFAGLLANRGMLETCEYTVGAGTPCGSRSVPIRTRFFDEETVRAFTTRVGEDEIGEGETSSWALGWDTPSGESTSGDYFSATSFGMTGFTGTSIWIDPDLDVFVVLLTNRVDPTRENTRHVAFRRRVHDLVATAITDRDVRPRDGR